VTASKNLIGLSLKTKPHEKVADLAVKAVVTKAAIRPVTFLQVNSIEQEDHPSNLVQVSARQVAVEKLISFLKKAGARTGSTILTNAAMHAKMSEDHFVKVRALIKDLLVKLEADRKSEMTSKTFCDSSMSKAVSDRDTAKANIEMANAKITTFTANQVSLEDDIRTLQSDIADLKKGVLESTELQAEDQAALKAVENMSEEAIESVKMALNLLQKFYSKAFLQTDKYVPAGADRHGNNLESSAPKVFENKYHASQQESKGIMGILNVILSDFERIEKKSVADEENSEAAFEKLKDPLMADISLKEKEIKKKDGEVSDVKSDIIDQQQALADGQDLLESGQGALESLHAMCVAGEETWEERKKKREDEIEALKDAMGILESWQGEA